MTVEQNIVDKEERFKDILSFYSLNKFWSELNKVEGVEIITPLVLERVRHFDIASHSRGFYKYEIRIGIVAAMLSATKTLTPRRQAVSAVTTAPFLFEPKDLNEDLLRTLDIEDCPDREELLKSTIETLWSYNGSDYAERKRMNEGNRVAMYLLDVMRFWAASEDTEVINYMKVSMDRRHTRNMTSYMTMYGQVRGFEINYPAIVKKI